LQILTLCESIVSGRTTREVKDLDIANIIKTLYFYAGSVSYKSQLAEYEPLGVVALIGLYDSSLLSLVPKLAAALAAGNTCLIVPHKLNPLSAYMFMDICMQSGVPAGVINLVVSDKDDIYKWVSSDTKINCISFDGRANVAQDMIISQSFIHPNKKTLFSLEGKYLKNVLVRVKCSIFVFELKDIGLLSYFILGKSSMVIYDSADIDSACESVVDGFLYSNGQVY
jgi:aldehyde dehydrogenase (NAD+)